MSLDDTGNAARANIDADPADELVVDFGAIGIWLYNGGTWTQIRS